MHSSNPFKHVKRSIQLFTLSLSLFFFSSAQAQKAPNDLMPYAIVGSIASLVFACYQGKTPCTLDPKMNSNGLVFSFDRGQDNQLLQERVAIGMDWAEAIYEGKYWRLQGRWDLSFHHWHSERSAVKNDSGYIIGLTPIFRYILKDDEITPYIEMGAGPHFLDSIYIEDENKSTQLQFGDHLGIGFIAGRVEVGYRYIHISNANIELPNPGTDFHNLHFAYRF
ncbi:MULTISPECIES: acyloxyacyl hydrolase [Thiomicrorhabdus]|uniref:Acyloxyacyl hydrolase n=1 Tax=Thiomicrorhabdus heinhorstiae TaxID=2748010 RepID=A0ABS0BYN2_9GAMM|nr:MULTISPECIES: acyloxyacyl hydrolase [Thiomicrorhabdus]MBF6057951.1 acyloxyacyl hydrolase [Thiomicrorhabdus heinhorstiae]